RRRCNAIHNTKASFLGVLHRGRSGGLFACGVRRSTRKVGTNLLPVQAAVGSLHDVLRSQIWRVLLQRREDQHRLPWVAILALVNLAAEIRSWPRSNVLAQRGAAIPPHHAAVYTGSVDDVRIAGIGGQPSAFASADHKPVARCDQSMIGSARYRCAAAVLLGAVNVVRKFVVGDHVIELPDRLVEPGRPRLAVVEADGCPLVGANDPARRILGIEPELVVVVAAWRATHNGNAVAAIVGTVERNIRNVNDIGIAGVNGDPVEIPPPAGEARIAVGEGPGVAAVVGAVEARLP